MSTSRHAIVYKIVSQDLWQTAEAAGVFKGSKDDQRDGFIHFSTATQLAGTAERHFWGQEGLLLVAIDATTLGDALRYEPSRDGELFPHLYGDLPMHAVLDVQDIPLGSDKKLVVHGTLHRNDPSD